MMNIRNILSLLLLAVVLTGCRSVAITGRKQLNLVSDADVLSSSLTQYRSFMSTAKVSSEKTQSETVTRVGQRIAAATEKYLTENGMQADLQNYAWEFNLVKSDEINAFCMPGGKIVVYEGILPVTQDEAGLAIVLGHEIAHAVAKHSAEQMSKQARQQQAAQIGGALLGMAGVSGSAASIADMASQIGFNFANLKYSRDNETEADRIGLVFAAMAGYDPNKAVEFWQRMASLSTSNQSEIFSDHPSDAKRIAALQQVIPEAMKYYKPATTTTTTAKKKTTTTKKKTTTTKKKK